MGPWWIKFAAWLLDFPKPRTILASIVLFSSIYGALWTLFESSGITGSLKVMLVLLFIAFTFVALLMLILSVLKWKLLFAAVKDYVGKKMWGSDIDTDTILVGGGPGGGIAVGMVAKALHELGKPGPKILVVDQDYVDGNTLPHTGNLLPEGFCIRSDKVLYVSSYIGTGRSREAVLDRLGLSNVITFAFVVDEALTGRYEPEHYLVRGRPSLIPWPISGWDR